MDLGLTNKVVFITGASRGIGLAIAQSFLQEGANVAITARQAEPLAKAEKSLNSTHLLALQGDMTNANDIRHALDETVKNFGQLDIVVANVGSGTARGGWDLSAEDWQTVLNTNLLGSMTLTSLVMPHLLKYKGNLIFISSIVAGEAINAPLTYSAAKAALQNVMKNLSRLVGQDGVRVNAVSPGNILFEGGSWERKLQERGEFFKQYIQNEVPLQRFGKPEEIADAVVFLASVRASFITGACLVVDGGQTRAI